MIEVKICGLKRAIDVEATIKYGASWAGFVFYEKSVRNVNFESISKLSKIAKNKVGVVALFVDANIPFICEVIDLLKPDLIQLHGSETPEQCIKIKLQTGIPLMKAIAINDSSDLNSIKQYIGKVDKFLFDSKFTPKKLNGLKNNTIDWNILKNYKENVNWVLAGGLTPNNIKEAINTSNSKSVDVSGGVEIKPGFKSSDLIMNFINNATSAYS